MSKSDSIKVMLVDDSSVCRGSIARLLEKDKGIEVVSIAGNGRAAVANLERQRVDVVILDIEMPVLDGLSAIPELLKVQPGLKIIMASTLSQPGAQATFRALELGAADYIAKPSATDLARGYQQIEGELLRKVRALGELRAASREERPAPRSPPAPAAPLASPPRSGPALRPSVLAIGASTGGPNALSAFVKGLGKDFPLPILIVQHMPPLFTALLAERLERDGGRPCAEARNGDELDPRRTLLAPGNFHLCVGRRGEKLAVETNQEPPENFCRPAVDPLFRSLAETVGNRVLAVVLTGMGADGKRGAEALVQKGARVLCQDEATSVVWGMPGAVAKAHLAEAVLPLERLPNAILELVRHGN